MFVSMGENCLSNILLNFSAGLTPVDFLCYNELSKNVNTYFWWCYRW